VGPTSEESVIRLASLFSLRSWFGGQWSMREIELLGKRPDGVMARMLGRTRRAVQLKRYSLGIPQCWEDRRPWTPKEEALLGTMRDAELAE